MSNVLNGFLMFVLFVTLYFCIEKYKRENFTIENEKKLISNIESINMDRLFNSLSPKPKNVKMEFNYNNDSLGKREIDLQYFDEQKRGVTQKIIYPNTWIEKIDEKGNPIYNSLSNIRKTDELIDYKAEHNFQFDRPRVSNLDGIIKPEDIKNGVGKSIRQIYDRSFVDYKKLIPKKNKLNVEQNSLYLDAGSNESVIIPDTWIYEKEKPENGGMIGNNLYANDPSMTGIAASYI